VVGADRVPVVCAAPVANAPLWSSLATNALADVPGADGTACADVRDAWRALHLEHDRFAWLDTAALVTRGVPTSNDFKDRYRHLAL
jgi:hypothetical protein